MRRCITAVAAVAIALATAGSAFADRPDRFPSPAPPASFPAGDVCPFTLSVTPVVDRGTLAVHFDKLGGVRWIHGSGHLLFRFSNDDTRQYIDLNVTGPGKATFDADGTAHFDGQGHWALLFFLADSPPSTALYIKGHVHFTVAPDGKLTLLGYTGTAKNICDMLS